MIRYICDYCERRVAQGDDSDRKRTVYWSDAKGARNMVVDVQVAHKGCSLQYICDECFRTVVELALEKLK